jgi:hypothetical protein
VLAVTALACLGLSSAPCAPISRRRSGHSDGASRPVNKGEGTGKKSEGHRQDTRDKPPKGGTRDKRNSKAILIDRERRANTVHNDLLLP